MSKDSDENPRIVRMPSLLEDGAPGRPRFLRRPGDVVAADEPVLEIELIKICAELTAPRAGVVGRLFAADDEEVQPDAPLYELWPLPTPGPDDDAPKFPAFAGVQQPCDVQHLLARAHALADDRVERPMAELALLCVATLRALATMPALLERTLASFLTEPGLRIACGDVQASGMRWVLIDVRPDASPEEVLAALKAGSRSCSGDAASATMQLVRIEPPGPPVVLPGPRLRAGLAIFAGPPTPQPTVVDGALAVRLISTLAITADPVVKLGPLLRFAHVLAEQIGVA